MTSVNASTQYDIAYILVFRACHILRHTHCMLHTYVTRTYVLVLYPYYMLQQIQFRSCIVAHYVTQKVAFTKELSYAQISTHSHRAVFVNNLLLRNRVSVFYIYRI